MRKFLAILTPMLLALSACGKSDYAAPSAEATARPPLVAAYRALQSLESVTLDHPAVSLSLYRPAGNRITPEFLDLVNQTVNRVTWRSDQQRYGREDYWAQPSEFFHGGGDCEDFAIAKLAILRGAGAPDNSMGVEVLMRHDGRPHAVLVVSLDGEDWVLDNLEDRLIRYDRYPGAGYYRVGVGALWVIKRDGAMAVRAASPD